MRTKVRMESSQGNFVAIIDFPQSIPTTLICYCMPACYSRNQVRRLSELMNTLSPGGFWVSWFANLSNCKPYLKLMGGKKTARLTTWGDHQWWMAESCWNVLHSVTLFLRTSTVYCYLCWFRGEAKNTCALLDSRRMNNTGTLPETNTDVGTLPEANTV